MLWLQALRHLGSTLGLRRRPTATALPLTPTTASPAGHAEETVLLATCVDPASSAGLADTVVMMAGRERR